jgi:pyruvate/2-oxoglutarate dehydrogenase complex dihydrolipoamide acyltransferase (E2) component
MSHTLVVPPLDGSDTFVVEQYYVAVNDTVVAGQPFALVRSEHWAWDVPATSGGTVDALVAEPGSTVAPGAPLVELRDEPPSTNNEPQQAIEAQNRDVVPTTAAQRVRATPVARRMIAAHGLDLAALSGTGRGNIVTRADVLAVLENKEQHPEGTRKNKEQETRNRQTAAIEETPPSIGPQSSIRNLQFPQRSPVPFALTAIEVDLAAALATVNQHAARWARRGVTLTATACVAAATVAALGEHPLLHSAWHPDGIVLRSCVQLAIEHRTTGEHQRTLIPHAADLNAVGIARHLAHVAHDLGSAQEAATFVIVEHAAPWWAHTLPEGTCTAQLSVGAITQQPRVVTTAGGEEIVVRPTVVLTLAYDARAATQFDADALLCAIKRRLEHLHSL